MVKVTWMAEHFYDVEVSNKVLSQPPVQKFKVIWTPGFDENVNIKLMVELIERKFLMFHL